VELNIPPLREHPDDIPALCTYLLEKINRCHGCAISGITRAVLQLFKEYDWPGNVRELEHTLERAGVMVPSGMLDLEHFDFFLPRVFKRSGVQVMQEKNRSSLQEFRALAEREAIANALVRAKGNKAQAARDLNIPRSLLYEKIKRYRL
jgi:Transcriptional regulator containing PAS, AAA-type ATPase, and DNA-binding domains